MAHVPDMILQPDAPVPQLASGVHQPQPQGAALAQNQAQWDFGHNVQNPQLAPDFEFGELRKSESGRQRWNIYASTVLALITLGVGYCAYDLYVNDHNPFDDLLAYFDSPVEEALSHDPVASPQPTVVAKVKPSRPLDALKFTPGNPYAALPNRLLGSAAPMKKAWTESEESSLREGLEHQFRYQRFKAVQTIRQQRYVGSESLLALAVEDKGFWVRMWALVGMAEFGLEVPLTTVTKAVAGESPDLIANFFERFVHRPNAGQLYLMRQALHVVEPRARLVLLRAITHSKDEFRDLYMSAATLDPSPKVKAWVRTALAERGVAAKRRADLLGIVKGELSPAEFTRQSGAAAKTAKRPAPGVMSEDEVEDQLSSDEDGQEGRDRGA